MLLVFVDAEILRAIAEVCGPITGTLAVVLFFFVGIAKAKLKDELKQFLIAAATLLGLVAMLCVLLNLISDKPEKRDTLYSIRIKKPISVDWDGEHKVWYVKAKLEVEPDILEKGHVLLIEASLEKESGFETIQEITKNSISSIHFDSSVFGKEPPKFIRARIMTKGGHNILEEQIEEI